MNQPEVKISLKDTKELTCSCGHNYFREVIGLREISALISGTGKNEIMPIPVIICDKCQKPFEKPSIIT